MRLLQITDTHLPPAAGAEIRGVAPDATLARCLAHARRRHPSPRGFLLTGDLVHDDPRGYARLRTLFADAGVPVYCLPGNHDEGTALRQGLAGTPFVHDFANRLDGWLIALLDSTVAGQVHGHLSRNQLARLDIALEAAPDTHALICLHHQPVPHGSRWLDEVMLDNAGEFFAVVAKHPSVRGIAWGHTHQPLDGERGPLRLMGTPSSCMQFAQNSDEFAMDDRPPAYRWLELAADGGITTGVEWVRDEG